MRQLEAAMLIGVPKEIKTDEYRVGLTPPPWLRELLPQSSFRRGLPGPSKPGSIIVDVSIDQGGRAETSRPTTHSQPTFVIDGVVHYCVANMPGAVPRTSTFALGYATRPFVRALAEKGFPRAPIEDAHLQNGLNVHDGKITCRAVADALRLPYTQAAEVLR
jgi:alanine dehydrogenase